IATVLYRDVYSPKNQYSPCRRKIASVHQNQLPPRNSTRCHFAFCQRRGQAASQRANGRKMTSATMTSSNAPVAKTCIHEERLTFGIASSGKPCAALPGPYFTARTIRRASERAAYNTTWA